MVDNLTGLIVGAPYLGKMQEWYAHSRVTYHAHEMLQPALF